jgi:YegS/Rv2252/BmrU family lipid kinase
VAAIVNPATGHRAAQALLREVRAVAREHGVEVSARLTERPGHAVQLARDAAACHELLLAIGGDGTVSDVIEGAADADVAIGIIPSGTTNVVAKDLGIPLNPRAATAVALLGEARAVDVARAGGRLFVHMAGAGYDAEIMRRASTRWKRRLGWVAYLPPAFAAARYPAYSARLVIDGVAHATRARLILFALGASLVAPGFHVGDGIDRSDGQLDICVFNPPTIPATLSTLGWIMLGKPTRSRWQRQWRGRRIILSADRDVPVEADGDYIGHLPITVEIASRPVRIMTPRRD